MKLLSWNCQGLGSPLTVQALKALVVKEKPDLVFFMETKNTEAVILLQRHLKFPNSHFINPIGLDRGLAMFWQSHISLYVEDSNQHILDTICIDSRKGITMKLTCLHAPVSFQSRKLF